jgi:copper chaperone NosL
MATRIYSSPRTPESRPPTRPHLSWQRRFVLLLCGLAVGLWVAAFFQPWWQLHLFAPQYPNGLVLDISLTGLGRDVREINMLNHYIGMKGLDQAAAVERRLAVYALGFVALSSVVAVLVLGKRWNWAVLLPALGLPVGFVGDSMAWLYHFGHSLDRHAPLNIPAFTPAFFGWGRIGQFSTYAMPLAGFWLSLAALAAMLAATFWRYRICRTCPLTSTCSGTCPSHFVIAPPQPPATAPGREQQ